MNYLIYSFSLRLLYDEIIKITGDSTNIIRMNLDEVTIDDVINECSYYSLLNETKYIIVNNFKLNKENSPILKYLKDPHPQTVLILITNALDKRSSIYKEFNQNGQVIIIDELKNVNNKINEYCKKKNITIDYLAINQLMINNLNNYDLVLNEIDKINIITNKITKEDVNKYSIRLISEDNFAFCDAVINKNYADINRLLQDFIQTSGEVLPFIALMASQYRLIYAVKSINDATETLANKLEIHPYRVKLAKEKSITYTKEELQKKLLDLCDLDYYLKTSNLNQYILLKIFIVNI